MELSVINEQQVLGKNFRVFGTLSRPLFRALDVADWIEHSNVASMLASVDDDEKELHRMDTLNNSYSAWFLTEDGLYEVLMLSRKPLAREFKKKVKIILKSIRQNGGYIVNQENLTPEQIVAKALIVAQNIIAERDKQLAEMQPKADFFDAVASSKSAIPMDQVAKVLNAGIGRNKLFALLREKKVLDRSNIPYQEYVDRGYFRVIEQKYTKPNGETNINIKTLVYQRGIDYIRKIVA